MDCLQIGRLTRGMTTTGNNGQILVLCGTGTVGRRVATRLVGRGAAVRVGSRSKQPPFDWEDRQSWAPALAGARSAFVAYYPDLVVPGAIEAVGEFAALAVASGTQRLVLLSGRGEEQAQEAEQALQASGSDWTIVRSSFFAQNFSEKFFLQPILQGTFAFPADEVTEPFIDAGDIADVAVAALTGEGHTGQVYEVTGPRLMTFADAIGEIAKAADRQIDYQPISVNEYAATLAADGLPDDYITALTDVAKVVLDGRNSSLTDGVRRALGREPRDFADYARDAAATGVWNR